MDFSRFAQLTQVNIEQPCAENWNEMTGDEQKRHCAACDCHVHNIAEMRAEEAESLLSSPGRVCTRLTLDDKERVLTRDGWIPRMLVAGAVAATVAGCAQAPAPGLIVSDSSNLNSTGYLRDQEFEVAVETILPSTRTYHVLLGIVQMPRPITSSNFIPEDSPFYFRPIVR